MVNINRRNGYIRNILNRWMCRKFSKNAHMIQEDVREDMFNTINLNILFFGRGNDNKMKLPA